LFHELVSNASFMAWSRFHMGRLPHANLGTVLNVYFWTY